MSRKMQLGTGGLGSDPEAAEHIDAPGRGSPLPHVAPHSDGQFDTMRDGPPIPHDKRFDDREAGTETLKGVVIQAGRAGDTEIVLQFRGFLMKRLKRHELTTEEVAALEDSLHLTQGPAEFHGKRVYVHVAVCSVMLDELSAGRECSYIDAIRKYVPDWIGMHKYHRR